MTTARPTWTRATGCLAAGLALGGMAAAGNVGAATESSAPVLPAGFTAVPDPAPPRLSALAPGSEAAWQRQREFAAAQGLPIEARDALGIRFRLIPPGTSVMGSPEDEEERWPYEVQREMTIARPLWVAVHEVTQEQWEAVMGADPSHFGGEQNLPVEQVSWEDCQEFTRRLNALHGGGYRLLTEAEWEYCCRAGTATRFCFGDRIDSTHANLDASLYDKNGRDSYFREETTPVGMFLPNAWGLCDMHGNVWEWCEDVFDPAAAATGLERDRFWPVGGEYRADRGGGWHNRQEFCRSAARSGLLPQSRYSYVGLRLAREAGGQ